MTSLAACADDTASRQLSLLDCRNPPTAHCAWNEVYADMSGASFGSFTSMFDWLLAQSLP